MPGVLDFLFEGRPPSSVTTYGETVENIPKWLSDYTQGLIGRANVIAAEPYQEYGGPRISGWAPEQLEAFESGRENIGAWQPGIETAGGLTQAGAASFPGQVGEYMDPYIGNVLDRQAELSQRQLTEQFIPELQSAFVGSGSFGGDRMMDLGIRGTRDIAEGLQGQQLGALSQAYGQAGQLFQQDRARELAGGQQMGALAEAEQAMLGRDVAGLEAIGAQQRGMGQQSLDLAYQDFQQQRDYPRSQVDWMSNIVRGLPSSTQTTTSQTGPADIYGPSPLSQIASLYSTYRGLQPGE
jgi:hypothetical protein